MNAYQKTTVIVAVFLLPLLLLFMKAMGYAGVWIVGAVGIGVSTILVYTLRNAQDE